MQQPSRTGFAGADDVSDEHIELRHGNECIPIGTSLIAETSRATIVT